MVRLSLVNLYLHGFARPKVYEYDSLTSLGHWDEHFDLIMANPPFMSPKGGIRPHNKFSVTSSRSEVLFVDYIAEHLLPTGRAAVIVPEGIIFQSQGAYVQLRKALVEDSLVAVVSLPAGVFNPYSGVKTSILFLDKALARSASTIAFFKVENDGYGLGAQRREIEKNDLPQVKAEIGEYLGRLRAGEAVEDLPPTMGLVVAKEKVAGKGEYNLSGERYREGVAATGIYPLRPLSSFCSIISGQHVEKKDYNTTSKGICYLTGPADFGTKFPVITKWTESPKVVVVKGDILLTVKGSGLGKVNVLDIEKAAISRQLMAIRPIGADPAYVYTLLSTKFAYFQSLADGAAIPGITRGQVFGLEIPLPPLDVQKEIVAEIESYQRIIDGARSVVDNYRPHIPIRPEWPVVLLEDACEIQRGKFSYRPRNEPRFYGGKYPFIQTGDVVRANGGKITFTQTLNEEGLSVSKLFQPPVVVITIAANIGDTAVLDFPSCFPDSVVGLIPKQGTNAKYLEVVMRTKKRHLNDIAPQAAQKNINIEILKTLEIPLPPLDKQHVIVAEIEAEQTLVDANRELIERFERKIQVTLARVWGEEK